MQKTQAEISKLKGVSRPAVKDFLNRNGIKPTGKKGKLETFDCSQEPLKTYLSKPKKPETKAAAKRPQVKKPPKEVAPKPPENKKQADIENQIKKINKPLNDLLAGRIPEGQKPSTAFYAEAVALAKKNQDAALLFKFGQLAAKEDADEIYQQQRLKTEQATEQIAIEKANRLKLENDIKRGEYMEKAIVKLLFGKVYAVHSNILSPLDLKIADMLNSLPESPDRLFKMKDIIGNEITSALESIKKLLIDFIDEKAIT